MDLLGAARPGEPRGQVITNLAVILLFPGGLGCLLYKIISALTQVPKKLNIDLGQSSFKGPAGLSYKAEAYLESKMKRLIISRQIKSLSQNLESALAQMAENTIDMNDLKTTINYLCRIHSLMWPGGVSNTFFQVLRPF